MAKASTTWWLLIHQLPPEPAYLRVKLSRRLQRLGAVALKNSVYALPRTEAALEDFQWLVKEIRSDGAEASLCEARFVDGRTDADLRRSFLAARDQEYREIEDAAAAAFADLKAAGSGQRAATEAQKLQMALQDIVDKDFLQAPRRRKAERAVSELLQHANKRQGKPRMPATGQRFAGRTWVTREGIKVDRIASAWLIKRFIDKKARFRFVDPKSYRHGEGELRFDMFEAEYTHEGDRCSFETLVERFGVKDRAVRKIAEIVHDLDVKDERFGRAEAAGVALILDGIVRASSTDADRLRRGGALFNDLHVSLSRGRPT